LVVTLCAIDCYTLSLGRVTWVLISESFPTESVAPLCRYQSGRFGSALLLFIFPLLMRALGAAGTFGIYATICMARFSSCASACPKQRESSGGNEREQSGPTELVIDEWINE
jgi:hypothetical protein